jgi:hypothetical protein
VNNNKTSLPWRFSKGDWHLMYNYGQTLDTCILYEDGTLLLSGKWSWDLLNKIVQDARVIMSEPPC